MVVALLPWAAARQQNTDRFPKRMELFLNAIWLLLSAAVVGGCIIRTKRTSCLRGVLALGCVLVLLFPVISASDDLHAAAALVEDSKTRTVSNAACRSHRIFHSCAPVAALLAYLPSPTWLILATNELFEPVIPTPTAFSSASGRAPPALFCRPVASTAFCGA
jgi:hypothetical protein